jgi:D-ribose pyranose/furanose isomerase RbsD
MPKTRLNVSLDQDLAEFAKVFAAENRTSVADMVTQYLLALKRRVDGESMEKILAHPAFQQAMEEVQAKLRTGTAQWHSYDEVFED